MQLLIEKFSKFFEFYFYSEVFAFQTKKNVLIIIKMTKAILIDTIDSVLKGEKIDDEQKKAAFGSISTSRYSKLRYNQTQLNPQVINIWS